MQPRGSSTHVFFAAHPNVNWAEISSDPTYGLIVSEGETRSLAGGIWDLAVVSLTGVDCGQVSGELHPDLQSIQWRSREVFLAFDSDVTRKAGPKRALLKFAALLLERGARVYTVHIPAFPDGSKQGLDDYLKYNGVNALKALLSSPETVPASDEKAYCPPVALADLMSACYPPTEWAWDSFILKGEVNLMFGDGGVGKSLLALYLGIAVAAGKTLFGKITTQMPVVGLFAEDGPAQVQQRVTTILVELGLDAKGSLPVKLWCQPGGETALARIDDNGVVTELPRLHALRAELADSKRPALLILDSLADLFALNESLRLPVNAALKQVLGGLCRDYAATVLVLAHPSKASIQDGTHYSGSTAFNNGVRQRLTLEIPRRDADGLGDGPPPRILRVSKSNYGATAEKTLWYYGVSIVELPRAVSDDGKLAAFHKACVGGAVAAAHANVPCNRKHINARVFEEATVALGRRPSQKQVLSELERAAVNGELVYLTWTSKRAAGFYPADREAAIALSLAAKRAGKRTTRENEHA
jgi:hypothetical protein